MTATTMTLTDFLLARIAEDEAEIESFGDPAPMEQGPIPYPRMLAECEAKRRIVEAAGITAMGATDVEWIEVGFMRKRAFYPSSLTILRALASIYAGHPDYRDEWAL